MTTNSETHPLPIGFKAAAESSDDVNMVSGKKQAPERILRLSSRGDNIRYTSLKTSFILERRNSVVLNQDMNCARWNEEIISALEKNYMQVEEKSPSTQNHALSREYSTWSMLSDHEDDAEYSEKNPRLRLTAFRPV